MTFHAGVAGNLLKLKRGTKASLEVALPAEFDKAMQHDGLTEKPRNALGPKQWWLEQMIGGVPLDYWTRTCGSAAAEMIEAVPAEYAATFVRGWLPALARRPAGEWIEPLVAAAGAEIRLEASVLAAIGPAERAGLFKTILRGPARQALDLSQVCAGWQPLDAAVSKLIAESYGPRELIATDAHFYLHLEALGALEARLTGWEDADGYRRRVEQFLAVIALRRDLHKEFA